jgi:lipopolysaccharide/colanic/teichoic acid biosynthesis glycosyltransferase
MLRSSSIGRPDIDGANWGLAHERTTFAVAEPSLQAMTALPSGFRLDSPVRDHPVLGWFDVDKPIYSLAKRAFDLTTTTFAILLLVPAFAMIALLLLLEGTRPVLFRQRRIGRGGRPFWMLKFRTMRPDRRQQDRTIDFDDRRRCLKVGHDPRITQVGAFLRRTSLDELPQLLNVVLGDMSLVGPRPELLAMLRFYDEDRHFIRHDVTPGLTGWWQINSRTTRQAEVDPKDDLDTKAREDSYYVANRSLWLDLKILFRTARVVVLCRGAF